MTKNTGKGSRQPTNADQKTKKNNKNPNRRSTARDCGSSRVTMAPALFIGPPAQQSGEEAAPGARLGRRAVQAASAHANHRREVFVSDRGCRRDRFRD